MKAYWFGLLFLALVLPAAATDREARRAAALNRPRRVIIDNDGGDVTTAPAATPATPEAVLKQRMVKLLGREIDTVAYCPGTVGLTSSTRSKVTDLQGDCYNPGCRNLAAELIRQGTDSLEIISKFCREHELELWASIRVNDVHDMGDYPNRLSKFKREHPQLIFGARPRPRYGAASAFDFAEPEVRRLLNAQAAEYLENYDLDGICLDFIRNPLLFRSVAYGGRASDAEREDFTESMRQLRRDADRVGDRAGRYLLTVVRVPDSLPFCREAGMDVETWLREKLVDILIVGGDRNRLAPLSEAIGVARRHGAKVYVSVDNDRLRVPGDFSRRNDATLRAKTAAAYAAGADGVFYFNLIFGRGVMPIARRSADDLKLYDKKYFVRYMRNVVYAAFQEDYNVIPELISATPLLLPPGGRLVLPIEIGDDPADPAVRRHDPRFTLHLKTAAAAAYPLRLAFNEQPLSEPSFAAGVFSVPVPPAAVRPGENRIVLSLDPAAEITYEAQTILTGREKAVPPWRRLFEVHDPTRSERFEDGACLLRDTGRGRREMANLLYPLPDLADTPFRVSFELKVEKSSAPDAVALRIANGRFVEVVRFEPHTISLRYAGTKAAFRTDDRFHAYEIDLAGDAVTVKADGKTILASPLKMAVTDPASRLDASLSIPRMNEQSLLIGSLSGPGTGESRWRSVGLAFLALPVLDCRLDLNFPAFSSE